ncbi:NACHT and WD domain protein [Apiospora aurea]|uniref:NACHT and WD domain protein n=1 Tax=Apiospora aurea TaxID=335848 RepID=A0ABR1QXR4_9PEZI
MDNARQMPRLPRSEPTGSRPSFLERRLSRLTTPSRSATSSLEDTRGPLGLNLLHEPSETHVDLVFGGSRKTWSASADISTFWPQIWLPSEPGFKNVRIHSYGYNSDWAERKGNALNILDFGKGLVGDLNNSPEIRRSEMLKSIAHHLGAPDRPEDELTKLDDIKIKDSCQWLTNKSIFLDWQSGQDHNTGDPSPDVFWLSGRPGCGKSVLTSHVIKHNNKEASSASALLRSLTCQMAETSPLMRQELLAMVNEAEFLNQNDEKSVWKTTPGWVIFTKVIQMFTPLAAASYQDGDLVIFNPFDGQQQAVVATSAHVLASSPDGRTLATGEPDDAVREPISDEIPHPALLVDYKPLSEDSTVTAIFEHPSGKWILGGRENGAVCVFDITTGAEVQQLLKPSVIAVKSIAWSMKHDYLSLSDISGSFNVRRVAVTPEGVWTMEKSLSSRSADRPIEQLVFDPSGTQLLVSTDTIDEIWNIAEARVVHSIPRHSSTTWHWLNDPLCGKELLLIEPKVAHAFAWKDFERLSVADGIELPGTGTPKLILDNVISSRSGRNLCVRLLKPSDSNYVGLQVYSASSSNSKATSAKPIAAYRTLAGRVKTIVGVHRSSLVFLDIDGWI